MKDLPESYWHHGYRRLRLEEPSKAITGAARNELLHPEEDRCLTLECARAFPGGATSWPQRSLMLCLRACGQPGFVQSQEIPAEVCSDPRQWDESSLGEGCAGGAVTLSR